jgi:hypothetical protein
VLLGFKAPHNSQSVSDTGKQQWWPATEEDKTIDRTIDRPTDRQTSLMRLLVIFHLSAGAAAAAAAAAEAATAATDGEKSSVGAKTIFCPR